MRRRLAPLLLACCAAFGADKDDVAPDPLASVILGRIAASDVPACIAVADVAQKTRLSFGCSKDAHGAALDRDAMFEIGSITKAFTGILLADMALKGEVSLDDPASKHSPPGVKLPARGGRQITLRDLATHTAGLPRRPPGSDPSDPADPHAGFDSDKLYAALARTELSWDIGARYRYSNFGYLWLSDIVSRVGGGTYEQVLRRRVLAPLGMKDTAIAPDGGLRSTLADMAIFAEALAGRRDSPLHDAIELALEPQRPAQGATSTGLAWRVLARPRGRRIAAHDGATAGFHSTIAVDRGHGRAAVVLADGPARFDDLALHLVDGTYPLRRKRTAIRLP